MEIILSFGNVNIKICSEASFQIEERIMTFLTPNSRVDSILEVVETDILPDYPTHFLGEDLFVKYYEDDVFRYAVVKPGTWGLLCMTVYRPDFIKATMYVMKNRNPAAISSIGKIIQLMPIRALLTKFGSVLLHASQVVYADVGILFTAPSGTGKTTQARLWNEITGAFIACNDRTLVFRQKNGYMTSGFLVDGREPVYSSKQQALGAIVILKQGLENSVRRLSVFAALKFLVEQTVADIWDHAQRENQIAFWMDVISKHPVYELICTPDQRAVHCLKRQLLEDKVIK